jgi:hypothetical protein
MEAAPNYLNALAAIIVVLALGSIVVGVRTLVRWIFANERLGPLLERHKERLGSLLERHNALVSNLIMFFVIAGLVFLVGLGPMGLPLLRAVFAGILAPFVLVFIILVGIMLFAGGEVLLAIVAIVASRVGLGMGTIIPILSIITILSTPAVAVALIQLAQAGLPLAPTAFLGIVTAFAYHKFGDRFWAIYTGVNRTPPSVSYAPSERQAPHFLRAIHVLLNNIPRKTKMAALLSIILFPFSLYLILVPGFKDAETQFAYATFGVILGFWLKFPKAGYLNIVVLPVCLYIIARPGLFDDTMRSLAFSAVAAMLGVLLK